MNRQQFLLGFLTIPFYKHFLHETSDELLVLTGKKSPVLHNGLQFSASKAFAAMKKEAHSSGIHLHIASAYRSYFRQLSIWNGKYERYRNQGLKGLELIHKINEFSAIPGTSRHHWGTDADVLDLAAMQPKNPLFAPHYVNSGGVYNKLYDWMSKNAPRFDFYETYTKDLTRTGFQFEPWHYSYQPIATEYLAKYNKNISLVNILSPELKGKDLLDEPYFRRYLQKYINGINSKLL